MTIGTVCAIGSTQSTAGTQAAAPYAPTFLSKVEWEFVNAVVARMIPSDGEGPGGIEAGVPEFIDRQLELPYGHGAYFYMQGPFVEDAPPSLGYQLRYTPRDIYRLGIAAANRSAVERHQRLFPALEISEQDRFLGDMESNALIFSGPPAAIVFNQILTNAKEGYFADPQYGGNRNRVAWKWIGFPGARADYTDWIDQAGRPYPYEPVSISGASS